MPSLKEKYKKLSSLFNIGLFINHLNKSPLDNKLMIELYNFIKAIQFKNVNDYFDLLFEFVEHHKNKSFYQKFLEDTFEDLLYSAKKQVEFVTHELEKLETEVDSPSDLYFKKFDMLKHGFYCTMDELDEMLDYFAKHDAFEICNEIVSIKKKYYTAKH